MRFAFEVLAAKPKGRQREEDTPTQAPMRAGIRGPARNPSTDQKKVRHQQARQISRTADQRRQRIEMGDYGRPDFGPPDPVPANSAGPCPACGSSNTEMADTSFGPEFSCNNCGYQGTQDDEGAQDYFDSYASLGGTMDTSNEREARLLAAMAKASLTEQRQIEAELTQIRMARRTAIQDLNDTDLAAEIIHDHLTPVLTHALNTTATDWLGDADLEFPETDEVTQAATAEASLWYQRVSPEVRADRGEFTAQAMGYAHRYASQYGPHADVAADSFLRHATHLQRAATDNTVHPDGHGRHKFSDGNYACPHGCPIVLNDAAEYDYHMGWHRQTDKKGAKTAGDLSSFVVPGLESTAEVEEDDGALDEFAFEGAIITADDKPGQVDPEQSGEAKSTLPYDETIANDTDPMWSEDWPGADATTVDPAISGAGDQSHTSGPDDDDLSTSGRRVTAKSCAECGHPIERDPKGEENRTWHHADGEKHDHEARPGADKESSREVLGERVWSIGYTDAVEGRHPRVAKSTDLGSDPWYYTEGYTAGLHERLGEVVGDTEDGAERGVPEEIKKLDDPHNEPMWPWELDANTPGSGAANVAGVPTPGQKPEDYPQPKKSGAKDDGSIYCKRCNGTGMVRAGGAVRNCTACGGSGIKRTVVKKNPGLKDVLPDYKGSVNTERLAGFRSRIAANLDQGAA